jgi:hypothetical protein
MVTALKKIDTESLPPKLRLKGKKQVYVRVFEPELIDLVKQKMKTHRGLTEEELKVAAEAGLIDWDQRYFWTPEWQTREREADEDMALGRVGPTLRAPEEVREFHEALVKRARR